jgi:hypothetical protein
MLSKANRLPLASKSLVDCWVSIKLKSIGNDIRLHLKSKMPLISADEPLPPRGDMHEYFAPDSRLSMIRRNP